MFAPESPRAPGETDGVHAPGQGIRSGLSTHWQSVAEEKTASAEISEANKRVEFTPARARLLSDPGGEGTCANPFLTLFQDVNTASALRNAWACANAHQNRLTTSSYEATIELSGDITLSNSLSSPQSQGSSGLILKNGGRATIKKAASTSGTFVRIKRASTASPFRVILVDGIYTTAEIRNPTMLTLEHIRIEGGLLHDGHGNGAGINAQGDVRISLESSFVMQNVILGVSGYGGGICLGTMGSTANVSMLAL